MADEPVVEHVDVLVVGAGLSGIAAGYYLRKRCPTKSYTILEARDAIGGTWDLFRYPGVRSDSDMYTLGYSFRPWPSAKAIADGPSILRYVRETARVYGVDRHIRFNTRVCRASWSSAAGQWTVEAERGPQRERVAFTCNFLYMCSGYYDYASGYKPTWPGMERFGGRIVHPQEWPADLDYADKRVVVIGSGATAVTLVPAMAEAAEQVTMLQRSPTYIVARPSEDAGASWLRDHLPASLAHRAARWKAVLLGMYFYNLARKQPEKVKRAIIGMVSKELGPDYDVATNFTPRYNPWDQRLCLVPDADLFRSMRMGKASVVTGQIATFTEKGIQLESGEELAADIIVTATGLVMKVLSGMQLVVDGEVVDSSADDELQGHDVQRRAESGDGAGLHQRLVDAQVRADRAVCLSPRQLHAAPWLHHLRPPPHRSHRHRGAVAQLHLGLCAARARQAAAPGFEAAVEAVPELRARPAQPALGRRGRRHDGVPSAARAGGDA